MIAQGTRVKVRGTSIEGIVSKIEIRLGTTMNKATRVKYVSLLFDNGKTMEYTIDELKEI